MPRAIVLLVCLLFAIEAQAQPRPPACDAPEWRQFDFWVGDWDLTYGDGGKGRNRITKILDGCAILEEFAGAPGTTLHGKSFSTFDRGARRWKQAWVDNTGSYLDFTGGMEGDRMILSRDAEREGRRFRQRMIFTDIKAQSLKWLWQRSDDDGASWKTLWEIDYKRMK